MILPALGESESGVVLRLFDTTRWREGFKCPACGFGESWFLGRGLRACKLCHRQVSVLIGTPLQRSRVPLPDWHTAIALIANAKSIHGRLAGVSAAELERHLGLASYETARRMLTSLRIAMATAVQEDRLTGEVRVGVVVVPGSTYRTWTGRVWSLDGPLDEPVSVIQRVRIRESTPLGFAAPTKVLAMVAVEVRPAGWLTRIRIRSVRRRTKTSLSSFIRDVTDSNARVEFDDYGPEVAAGYRPGLPLHRLEGKSASFESHPVTRAVEIVHRWWGNSHRSDRAVADFEGLLAEFCFYYNRRRKQDRNRVQLELLRAALTGAITSASTRRRPASVELRG
jgi:hypothetical protein